MARKIFILAGLAFILIMISIAGCGSDNITPTPVPVGPVTISKINNTYYRINLDLTSASHREIGQKYGEAINLHVTDYEEISDAFLEDMVGELSQAGITFEILKNRALDIKESIPQEYVDEIDGMSSVFSYSTDILGDGRLSQNELLLLQLVPDIMRPTMCSASAVFGTSSYTGNTIVGRNLDWFDFPDNQLSKIHAVTVIKNGDKSVTIIGSVGQLWVSSAFNDDKVFGAILDSDTEEPYPDTSGIRSYVFDLRYALENTATLQGVVDFFKDKDYAYNHLIFLADENSAGVLEEDMGSPGRGLRTFDSTLRSGVTWGIDDAIATANSFVLPENFDNHSPYASNFKRWDSFRSLYTAELSTGKVDTDKMKEIMGYYGTDGSASNSGALFRSDSAPTIQSIILRMDTYEMWVSFSPTGEKPLTPTYIQVLTGSPF